MRSDSLALREFIADVIKQTYEVGWRRVGTGFSEVVNPWRKQIQLADNRPPPNGSEFRAGAGQTVYRNDDESSTESSSECSDDSDSEGSDSSSEGSDSDDSEESSTDVSRRRPRTRRRTGARR